MRPDFGCGIHDLVFAALTAQLVAADRDDGARGPAHLRGPHRRPARERRTDRLDQGRLDVVIDYEVRATNQPGNYVYPFYFRESATAMTTRSPSTASPGIPWAAAACLPRAVWRRRLTPGWAPTGERDDFGSALLEIARPAGGGDHAAAEPDGASGMPSPSSTSWVFPRRRRVPRPARWS